MIDLLIFYKLYISSILDNNILDLPPTEYLLSLVVYLLMFILAFIILATVGYVVKWIVYSILSILEN